MKACAIVKVPAAQIWRMWEVGYAKNGQKLTAGAAGALHKLRYSISQVDPGHRFTVVWKAYFARLHLSQSVRSIVGGTEIVYEMAVRGPFAIPVRWMLRKLIQKQLQAALDGLIERL